MSRADARFLLPFAAERLAVLDEVDGWRESLGDVGLPPVGAGDAAEAVVSRSEHAGRAAATGARALLLEGRLRGGRVPGYVARRVVAVPSLEAPAVLVPADRGNVARYVIETWLYPRTLVQHARKHLLAAAAPLTIRVAPRPTLTVALTRAGQPFLVEASAELLGTDPDADWFVEVGRADILSRNVFVLFARGDRAPSWVLKFSRLRGYARPFEAEERGLEVVRRTNGAAAAHAPRLLGRLTAGGYEALVETAAPGLRLGDVLRSRGPRQEKLELVGSIADWIVDVGVETRAQPGSAADEVDRIAGELLARGDARLRTVALGPLRELSAVLAHNDPGTWNVVAGGSGTFSVLDWELASERGLPLRDLWTFLGDALTILDGRSGQSVDAFQELFRGDAPSSPVLFGHTRRAVAALGVPAESVGELAGLCWLAEALLKPMRAEALSAHAPEATPMRLPSRTYADAWFTDPALGAGWRRWRDA